MATSLYAQVYDWDNLLLAHRKASKGKRGKAPAARFEYRPAGRCSKSESVNRSFVPRPHLGYNRVEVPR